MSENMPRVVDLRSLNQHPQTLLDSCMKSINRWHLDGHEPDAVLLRWTQARAIARAYNSEGELPTTLYGITVLVEHD